MVRVVELGDPDILEEATKLLELANRGFDRLLHRGVEIAHVKLRHTDAHSLHRASRRLREVVLVTRTSHHLEHQRTLGSRLCDRPHVIE